MLALGGALTAAPLIFGTGEDDEEDQEMLIRTKLSKTKAENIQKAQGQAKDKVPENLKEKIEQIPQASLMERR